MTVAVLVAACSSAGAPLTEPSPSGATPHPSPPAGTPSAPASPVPVSPGPTATTPTPRPSATAAPAWLGTRPLQAGATGFPPPQPTPDDLLPRSIVTDDVLPPPPDETFTSSVQRVDDAVAARSTWHPGCPVALADLRHVTVSHVGFDGAHHTGELLVHVDEVDAVLAIFEAMHAARFPLEQVAIITPADLEAPATGDGNVTSAFVCRQTRGSTAWSEHATGRALDINPFHNPYVRDTADGRVVLPELATAYADRTLGLPGMLTADGPVVAAVKAAGWHWGGHYTSLGDPMHVSATGR